jgi:hypothetical protein
LPRDRTGDLVSSGEIAPGEVFFDRSDSLTETGAYFSRRYDPVAELARIRGVWARQANARPRLRPAFIQNRSLRRGV